MSSPANRRYSQIGLDRFVRLEWLERTAYLVLAGNKVPTIKAVLQEELQGAFRSKDIKIRGSLDKTITILMKVWVRPPNDLHSLNQEGLKLLSHLPREDQVAVHWGMIMTVYPFWGAVATQVGRLLRLQRMVSHTQIRRRIMEQYGQRPTVKDSVRRVLRSMVDWRVLQDALTGEAQRKDGTYVAGHARAISQVELIAWLAEAFLHAHPNGPKTLRTVLEAPSLFPFHIAPVPAGHLVAVSGRFDLFLDGLNQELLMLRTFNQSPARGGN